MYNDVNWQYADLMKKRKIVLNDKTKIAAVIEELDQKKNEALTKAWEQVNKVRGAPHREIFLIPGEFHHKLLFSLMNND